MQWTDDRGRREIEIWSQQQVNGHVEGWEGGVEGVPGRGKPSHTGCVGGGYFHDFGFC